MISVKFESKPVKTRFEDLAEGAYFKYNGSLYFKLPPLITETNHFKVNAYNLTEGRIVVFCIKDFVIPISDDKIEVKIQME